MTHPAIRRTTLISATCMLLVAFLTLLLSAPASAASAKVLTLGALDESGKISTVSVTMDSALDNLHGGDSIAVKGKHSEVVAADKDKYSISLEQSVQTPGETGSPSGNIYLETAQPLCYTLAFQAASGYEFADDVALVVNGDEIDGTSSDGSVVRFQDTLMFDVEGGIDDAEFPDGEDLLANPNWSVNVSYTGVSRNKATNRSDMKTVIAVSLSINEGTPQVFKFTPKAASGTETFAPSGFDYTFKSGDTVEWACYLCNIDSGEKVDGDTVEEDGIIPDADDDLMSVDDAEFSEIAPVTYTGSAIKPEPTVIVGDETLVKGTDYTLSYQNNINVGTATITITGIGDYYETASTTFEIVPKSATPSITLSATSYTYDGTEHKPTTTVKVGSTTLKSSDYTVSYDSDCTSAGNHSVKVALKGNYSGNATATYSIAAKSATPSITLSATSYTYDGAEHKPGVTVKVGNTTLSSGNYTVSYDADCTSAGNHSVKVTLKGNYSGSATATYAITAKSATPSITLSATSYAYDGAAHKPGVTVKVGSTTLSSGNYTVSYDADCASVGTHSVKVTLKGNYSGSATATYTITTQGVTPSITLSATSYTYDGAEHKPGVTVKVGSATLASSNYSVSYDADCTSVGNHSVKVTLKGNYSGSATATYAIKAKSATPSIILSATNYTYDGAEHKPGVTVKVGNTTLQSGDYSVAYDANCTSVGNHSVKVTLKGNYSGSATATYAITANATTPTITLSAANYTYDGAEHKPGVTVKVGNTTLTTNDYSVSYDSNSTAAGQHSVKVTLKGSYSGSATATYTINPKKVTPSVELSKTEYVYNGSAIKPAATVKLGNTTLKSGDYSLAYESNCASVGKHAVKVTLKGNYSGTKSAAYTVNPKGTTIAKLSATAKALTVKWKKQTAKMKTARVTGYQVMVATDAKFTKNKKTATISGYTTAAKKIPAIKGAKKYYVKIRTYMKVDSKTYYSAWSKAKGIKAAK